MLKNLFIFCFIFTSHEALSNEIASGKEGSPITIIEYGSLTCDHCIGFHQKILPKIEEKYIKSGKVRFVFRHYPTSKVALRAAIAIECASKNHYEVLNNFYFNIRDWYSPKNRNKAFKKHAQITKQDSPRFEACLKSESIEKKIIADQRTALEKYGVHGTPTFIINEKVFKGEQTLQELEQIIQSNLLSN